MLSGPFVVGLHINPVGLLVDSVLPTSNNSLLEVDRGTSTDLKGKVKIIKVALIQFVLEVTLVKLLVEVTLIQLFIEVALIELIIEITYGDVLSIRSPHKSEIVGSFVSSQSESPAGKAEPEKSGEAEILVTDHVGGYGQGYIKKKKEL
jgi:hypothetical protein